MVEQEKILSEEEINTIAEESQKLIDQEEKASGNVSGQIENCEKYDFSQSAGAAQLLQDYLVVVGNLHQQFARDFADRVLFFDNGQIVESGKPNDIFSNPKEERTRSFLKKFISKLDSIPCIRGKRYVQPSKMSFFNLVTHSFSILSVFKYQVLLRSVLFFVILFLFVPNLYGTLFGFILIIFTVWIFLLSRRENSEELANCEKKITNIESIHTIRL